MKAPVKMTAFWVHIAGKKDIRTEHFARIDAAAQRQRVGRVGAQIPHGGETPSRQHLLHVRGERRGGCAGCIHPRSFGEMDVAVPEAGDDGFSGTIDNARIRRNWQLAGTADGGDDT
jgi:hypothetical protein